MPEMLYSKPDEPKVSGVVSHKVLKRHRREQRSIRRIQDSSDLHNGIAKAVVLDLVGELVGHEATPYRPLIRSTVPIVNSHDGAAPFDAPHISKLRLHPGPITTGGRGMVTFLAEAEPLRKLVGALTSPKVKVHTSRVT